MSDTRSLEIPGILYTCAPEYVSRTLLDPLAQFILEALEHEKSYPRLLRSFGLPPRVIEDILGDLIRLNLARLDLAHKEIHPTRRSVPIRNAQAGRPLELWHDAISGVVLEWQTIRHYQHPEGNKRVQLERPASDPIDFLELPHGLVIGMLERSRSLAVETRDGHRMERLLARRHVRRQSLYLPVEEVRFPDGPEIFLAAPDVPGWVLRGWNRALGASQRRQGGPALRPPEHVSESWWTAADLAEDVHRWSGAVQEAIERSPPPQSARDLVRMWRAFDALVARLRRRAGVNLRAVATAAVGPGHWLASALEEAAAYVVVALPALTASQVAAIAETVSNLSADPRSVELWLLSPAPSSGDPALLAPLTTAAQRKGIEIRPVAMHRPPPAAGSATVEAPWPGVAVIADGQRAWLGWATPDVLPTSLVEVDGEDAVLPLMGLLQQSVRSSSEADALLALTAVPRRQQSVIQRQPAVASAPLPVPSLEDRLLSFRARILAIVASPEEVQPDEAPAPASAAPGTGRHEIAPSTAPAAGRRLGTKRAEVQQSTLRARDPELQLAFDEIVADARRPDPSLRVPWLYVDGEDLHEVLIDAMAGEAARRSHAELLILSPSLGEAAAAPSFAERLAALIDSKGWSVMLVWGVTPGAEAAQLEIAHRLRHAVPDQRFSMRRLDGPLPIAAIIIDELVAIGLVDWLDRPQVGKCAYLFGDSTLRADLMALVAKARPLPPRPR